MKILQPPDWMAPRGYSNGILTEMTVGSKLVFVGGQVGWNGQQQFESDDLADQVRQTLANIVAILAEGGARPEHIVRMTWYVTDKDAYVAAYPEIGKHYRELIGSRGGSGRDRETGQGGRWAVGGEGAEDVGEEDG
ncbi:RidA family protein, partial [Streptomyces sp. NPDC002172]